MVIVVNLGLLVVAFLVTRWGALPMMRWSLGQLLEQLEHVVVLALSSLPILLRLSASRRSREAGLPKTAMGYFI